jgi:hypothetical protein
MIKAAFVQGRLTKDELDVRPFGISRGPSRAGRYGPWRPRGLAHPPHRIPCSHPRADVKHSVTFAPNAMNCLRVW